MIPLSKAKIFLSQQRSCNETGERRSLGTFNTEGFYNPHKEPVSNLHVLNDESIAAKAMIQLTIEKPGYFIVLPVVGEVVYKDSLGNKATVLAGQLLITYTNKDTVVNIFNPLDELINFMQLRVAAAPPADHTITNLYAFDIDGEKDSFATLQLCEGSEIHNQLPFTVSIGKFGGRKDAVYMVKDPGNAIFAFVIQGAFEVENRLLHARDALGLWERDTIEAEALSNDAILLLVETH